VPVNSQALPVHRERLLAAASEVFLADGFKGASVDVIAVKAGVSKVTIYRRYTSKAGLFEAVALRSVERLRRKSREVETTDRPPADVLHDFALAIYEGVTHAESVAVMRLAIAEASQFPEAAGEVFGRHGPLSLWRSPTDTTVVGWKSVKRGGRGGRHPRPAAVEEWMWWAVYQLEGGSRV
jgi:AcrR family transcriptional regulator